jgi:hypothetical protein
LKFEWGGPFSRASLSGGTGGAPLTREIGEETYLIFAGVSVGAAIAIGAVAGLALGILVSVITEVPLAPEIGVAFGALLGWLSRPT